MNRPLQQILDQVTDEVSRTARTGSPADYIPALSTVNPDQFGIAVAQLDGSVAGAGDWATPFSTQSISKTFALILALSRAGDRVWDRVGREPAGTSFNSLAQLELDNGIPRNPFLNAGALVVTDLLIEHFDDPRQPLLELLRAESGNPAVDSDPNVARSEAAHGHRNYALAHLMAGLHTIKHPVDTVLEHYFWQSSISMSCADLARAGCLLARSGLRHNEHRLLPQLAIRHVHALMLTCGTYDSSGDTASRIALPAKSGVGGGILAVMPGRGAVATWSPSLNQHGNSVLGLTALEHFTTLSQWGLF